jgi:peptidoglycan/LPS O-acetylase OafA/YrhL
LKPPPTGRQYYPALDGLRGVAILLVLFLHNFGFMNYFFFGWLGVDLFFVLSGFLITDILLSTVHQRNYLSNFYLRRIFRIFPVFYLALILCLFVIPPASQGKIDASYYQVNQVWLWTFLQNWLFIFKAPHGTPILLHTWSLAVEEQFYLLWPITILLIRRPRWLLLFMLSLLIFTGVARYYVWSKEIEDLAYGSLYTFTRIDGLCIGSMIAIMLRVNRDWLRRYSTWIVLLMAAINFSFYFINNSNGFSLPYLAFVGYTTFAVLFGLLVYEAVAGRSMLIQRIFTNKILGFFGKISYALYVFHWPVYLLCFDFLSRYFNSAWQLEQRRSHLLSAVSVSLLAVALSYASYIFMEKPLASLKKRYTH